MTVLVTGAAGFIGYHVAEALLARGEQVIGVDNVNDYYDVRLKEARLSRLAGRNGFTFHRIDLADYDAMSALMKDAPDVRRIVHLAAQAGVRYSIENPFAYVQANLVGHMTVLEIARHQPNFEHLVYASSSSVYGGNTKLPFSVDDPTDTPVSLYAATKKADELMSHSYSHLYRIPQTGLRFFTVYGPWGRPDMAMYIFCKAIVAGKPIPVFNHGDMRRDFTYIDDIVSGILASLDKPPVVSEGVAPCRVYNIGNHRSEPLMRMIGLIEESLGKKAEIDFQPMQPGDVKESFADIDAISRDTGFAPTTPIDIGVPKFVEWFKSYERV
ncbi:MAG: SDR family NAD(P)-dependent oxidoreductase [Proteobacteria bacterium]|nr:SDR family NAD(P)-dependent oxidoreductase [Pseudomonadota bacterium]MDA1326954.1 SDR family NAD(P)-dependent oxidoreductase [Pseudomonadota bacterium]